MPAYDETVDAMKNRVAPGEQRFFPPKSTTFVFREAEDLIPITEPTKKKDSHDGPDDKTDVVLHDQLEKFPSLSALSAQLRPEIYEYHQQLNRYAYMYSIELFFLGGSRASLRESVSFHDLLMQGEAVERSSFLQKKFNVINHC